MARNMDQVTSELSDMKLHDTLQGVLNNMQFNVCLAKYEESISNQSKKQNKQNIVYKLSDQKYVISNFTIDQGCIFKKGKYFEFEVINTHGGTLNCSCTTDPCCRHSQVVSGIVFKGVEIPILPSCLDGLWNVRSTPGRKTFLCTRANDTATVTYFIPKDRKPISGMSQMFQRFTITLRTLFTSASIPQGGTCSSTSRPTDTSAIRDLIT